MVDFQVRCTLRSADGVNANNCINTFGAILDPLSNVTDVAQWFADFYNAVAVGATYSLAGYINDTILRVDGLLVELIDSPQTPPNAPLYAEAFTLLPSGDDDPLPQEVAVCLSMFTADYLTSSTPGRERGRIYAGPLNLLAMVDSGVNAVARPSEAMKEALAAGFAHLQGGLATEDATVAIWSRAAGTFKPVTGAWIDNEFDTQRRRGHERTARTFL